MADYGHSLLLDANTWDLVLDQGGNISDCDGDYALAQDVANRIRLFTEDAYYQPDDGIPHFALDLGQRASESLIRARYREQALTVSGVTAATVTDLSVENRELTGTVEITTANGGTASVVI